MRSFMFNKRQGGAYIIRLLRPHALVATRSPLLLMLNSRPLRISFSVDIQ